MDYTRRAAVECLVAVLAGIGTLAAMHGPLMQLEQVFGVEESAALLALEVLDTRVPQHMQFKVALVREMPAALIAYAVPTPLLPTAFDNLLLRQVLPAEVGFLDFVCFSLYAAFIRLLFAGFLISAFTGFCGFDQDIGKTSSFAALETRRRTYVVVAIILT